MSKGAWVGGGGGYGPKGPKVLDITEQPCSRSILHMVMCVFPGYSLNSSHPLLPPLCPQSVLYVCISTAVLQIGSLVPF